MGLLDDYSGPGGIQGIGMTPRPTERHQECIAMFITELNVAYRKRYKILPESAIDLNNLNSKAPDVVVYDKATLKPVLFIEITTTRENRRIINKAKELMQQYDIYEAFIYDYEQDKWAKLTGISQHSPGLSFSDILQYDLAKCIDNE